MHNKCSGCRCWAGCPVLGEWTVVTELNLLLKSGPTEEKGLGDTTKFKLPATKKTRKLMLLWSFSALICTKY